MSEIVMPPSLTTLNLKYPFISGDVWTDNNPSAGSVSWNAHTLTYAGITYNIAAGSTSNYFIYWNGGSTYQTSNTPPALTDGQFIIATNRLGTHSAAYNKVNSTIDATQINVGVIRSISSFSSIYSTKGTNLAANTALNDATVNVNDTTDFPASGSAQVVDSVNDRNTFTYSGKTNTSLTGCVGVKAHTSPKLIIPIIKTVLIDSDVNEIRLLDDRGDGTIIETWSSTDAVKGGFQYSWISIRPLWMFTGTGGDWSTFNTAGGVINLTTNYEWNVATAASNGAYFSIEEHSPHGLVLESGLRTVFEFQLRNLGSLVNQDIYFYLTAVLHLFSYVAPTLTENHFGFRIHNGTLYATVANGTTETATDTGFVLVSGGQNHILRVEIIHGIQAKFFIDNVLKLTITTNLPATSVTDMGVRFVVISNEVASKSVYIANAILQHERLEIV
jgi:hypothetical protein